MLERLLGRFVRTLRFGRLSEVVDAVKGLLREGVVARVVLYFEGSDTVVVGYFYPDGRVLAFGYREGEGLVRPELPTSPAGGYAEVYTESVEQAEMDMELLESIARAEGKELRDVVREARLEELVHTEEGVERECSLGLKEIFERFGKYLVVDDKLSKLLSYPSTTGRILLSAEFSSYDKVECEAVKHIIMDHFEKYEGVAIKFSTGPYTAWVVKCGDRVGAALFEKSQVRLSGTAIIEKIDKVEAFVAKAIKKYGKATVIVYKVPKKLITECMHFIEENKKLST